MTAVAWLLAIAWLPGSVLFRIPLGARERRAALPAEERAFWAVVLSIACSLTVVLALALIGRYRFQWLLIANGLVALVPILIWRKRLAYVGQAPALSRTALLPVGIVALGLWTFPPPAEYVLGGKDPGVYMSEGIQIAQRGGIVIKDPLVAAVPAGLRDLFFPPYPSPTYYSIRFMGFFVDDPRTGAVIGQFPHLFPASIALGYDIHGLTGARQTVVFWAIAGLVALYFAAAPIVGPIPAAAAAVLLNLNVAEVWFARYPNAEMAMQALLLAAALAFLRARDGQQRFFGPIAGGLVGLLLFLRYDAVLAVAAFAAAGTLTLLDRRQVGWWFFAALAVTTGAGLAYLSGPMRAYSEGFIGYTRDYGGVWILSAGIVVLLACRAFGRSEAWSGRVRLAVQAALPAAIGALAIYAYFFRQAGGSLAAADADAFRTFAWYVGPIGLACAVAGAVLLVARDFWKHPALFVTFAVYSVFFFYKTRIVPEHFWQGRRFVAATFPAMMLALAALPGLVAWVVGAGAGPWRRKAALISWVAAWAAVAGIGVSYWRASALVRTHVEYAGLIPRLETLASRIGDTDLLIVESRNASDLHVLALPLAYVYARNVLVLANPRPSKPLFEQFIAWARPRYAGVYFLGGGGTDLLVKGLAAKPVASEIFHIPEYETSRSALPVSVRQKEFDYGLYRLEASTGDGSGPTSLQLGVLDDLNVVRFNAKERRAETGVTFRWSRDVSYVLLQGIDNDTRRVTIWMGTGGRPAKAAPPVVEVSIDDHVLGVATAVDEVRPFAFEIPADVVRTAAGRAEPAQLRLRVPTWNPNRLLGLPDSRDLGVLVTKVEVR